MRQALLTLALVCLLPSCVWCQQIITDISVPTGPIRTCLFGRSSVRISSPCYPTQVAYQPQPMVHQHYHYQGDNGDEAADELGDLCQQLVSTIQQQLIIDALKERICPQPDDDDDGQEEIAALMSQLMMLQKVQNGQHHHHPQQQPPITIPSIQQRKWVRIGY